MMDLKMTLPLETEGSLPGSIIFTEVLQEPARSARSAARFGYRLSIIGLCKATRGSPWSVVSARWRKASFLCYDSSIYEPGVSVARSPIAGCFRIFVDA